MEMGRCVLKKDQQITREAIFWTADGKKRMAKNNMAKNR
jgi:hypothetical protein